jgi:hypothetical protein
MGGGAVCGGVRGGGGGKGAHLGKQGESRKPPLRPPPHLLITKAIRRARESRPSLHLKHWVALVDRMRGGGGALMDIAKITRADGKTDRET